MKKLIFVIAILSIILTSCQKDDEIRLDEVGTVVDYAGAGNCGFIIELENGGRVQPLYYPDGFTFAQGQRVHIGYVELKDVVPSCDRGTPVEIVFVEELDCAPYIDLDFSNYDSLSRDPVFIHEAFIDGDCLQIKLSYSGGCSEHTINLARMNVLFSGDSNIPVFEIRHDANGDLCEAWFTKELRYDLTPLKLEGKKEFALTAKLTDGSVYNQIFDLE